MDNSLSFALEINRPKIWLLVNSERFGPLSVLEIAIEIGRGKVHLSSHASYDGYGWMELKEMPEFSSDIFNFSENSAIRSSPLSADLPLDEGHRFFTLKYFTQMMVMVFIFSILTVIYLKDHPKERLALGNATISGPRKNLQRGTITVKNDAFIFYSVDPNKERILKREPAQEYDSFIETHEEDSERPFSE